MKKNYILFLFVAVLGLAISSCSSDNDNDASIVGKWAFSQYGIGAGGQEALQDHDNEIECGKDYMEFFADGTYKVILFDKENGKCVTIQDGGQYTKNGSTLTLKGSEEEPEAVDSEIVILDDSTLKTQRSYEVEKVKVSEIFIYKKI
ncbi:lipocalin family protein [Flavobacterium sp. LS1R49]|uniref:Lipocalin family protein n=1 Tax=Flavobacterium shii TaxID=2987687 RepID=A0A9X2ZJJ3_9FLAO|nr:lipocalin family protein [Flavobacterium shii]MCV9929841.1 lipocalin family protein [Flavobacterium shii]